MIRLWISRESSIPIREQLSSQLLLGILSRRLAPGEKLPSVRDLARRLAIHGNTVHAVYRDLAKRGWVQARPGSGVFVAELRKPKVIPSPTSRQRSGANRNQSNSNDLWL